MLIIDIFVKIIYILFSYGFESVNYQLIILPCFLKKILITERINNQCMYDHMITNDISNPGRLIL